MSRVLYLEESLHAKVLCETDNGKLLNYCFNFEFFSVLYRKHLRRSN